MYISFCAVLCDAENWSSIERFGNLRIKWFEQFFQLAA